MSEQIHNSSNIQTELFKAIDAKNANKVRSLLSMDEITHTAVNSGFRHAVDNLNTSILNIFIESGKSDPVLIHQLSLVFSIITGDYEEFYRQLNDSDIDPSEFDNISLQLAVVGGHVDMVRALLADPRVDPRVPNYKPFFTIVGAGLNKVELLRIFLNDPRIDPTIQNNLMYKRIIEKMQDSKTSPDKKEEYEQMLELLRTGTRRLRVGAMLKSPQTGGKRTRRAKQMRRRRGTRAGRR